MNSDRRTEVEEVERALEILRARQTSFDRTNRTFWILAAPLLILIGGFLLLFVPAGIMLGDIGYLSVLIAVLIVGALYLGFRLIHPKDAAPADVFSGNIGYRRSDGAILKEQIAEHERRLESLSQSKCS